MAAASTELDRMRAERDLYRRLLDLGHEDDLEPFLEEALALMVEVSGAARGYVELRDERDVALSTAAGVEQAEIEAIKSLISRGVIAEALATGKTVVTESAMSDARFTSRASVKRNLIEHVLCAPVGGDPPLGVVYLEGRTRAGTFDDDDRARAETFASHVAVFADRLLARRAKARHDDATAQVRARFRCSDIIGRSAALAKVLEQAALVAPLDICVLLTGPSGTGKTQLARALHDNGPRAQGPFVELNCAALPESLIESELFGAAQGAHSAATKRVEGKVAAAKGGTLFLDEIGELPMAAQAKLLQLLQSKTYYSLGSSKPSRTDARLIVATNVDLEAAVAARSFREDLFYRLLVLPIAMPALAQRREDIAMLAEHFLGRAVAEHGLGLLRLSRRAVLAIESAEWPGNARQLANALEAAAIRASGEGGSEISVTHIFPSAAAREEDPLGYEAATRKFQASLVRSVLEDVDWNVTEAAARLDVARSHVYNLIRAFGLERHRR